MSRLLACTLLVVLTACAHTVQTTSGADYLRRYEAAAVAVGGDPEMPDAVRQAASVEPLLTLPARFGLARIVNGALTVVPAEEMELWTEFAGRHRAMGEFVPISPLVAAFAHQPESLEGPGRFLPESRVHDLVAMIREGAARQHVDAVLIYEVGARDERTRTLLALADLTLVGGAILPTRHVTAYGAAEALLMDVRNGYPYGTASAETDLSGFTTMFDQGDRARELRTDVLRAVVADLIPEVDRMVGELVEEMAARRLRTAG